MASGSAMNVGTPLRGTDATRLGPYHLLRRLGEGGMGTVYLARDHAGKLVAVKVIRRDLADEPEFRQRFRGEVAHAQTVPPFCTAEVLDADPDHETPYLVVEYVDGPSLSQVVAERGPLTPANLHGLAIGVATALTAIHRVGIIHRDLKPSNVLLAPGAPKVIDFGIARAITSVTANTRGDQLMGTVSYMAPERLEPATAEHITAAADIFAWGAVVAYAATGYPPFHSDTPATTAIAILTEEPDLGALAPHLRGLAAHALAKNPAHRPTARQLLDELLSATGQPGVAAPNRQPAIGRARSATDEALTNGVALAQIDVPNQPIRSTPVRVPDPRRENPPPGPAASRRGRSRGRALFVTALVLLLIATGGALAGVLTGYLRLDSRNSGGIAGRSTPKASGTPGVPPQLPYLWIQDPLVKQIKGHWRENPVPDPSAHASCTYTGAGFSIQMSSIGSTRTWRCRPPTDLFGNFQVSVTVRLDTPNSCAAIWFRFANDSEGYAMRICERHVYLGLHAGDLPVLQPQFVDKTLAKPLKIDTDYRFSIVANADTYTMLQCDMSKIGCEAARVIGQATDGTLLDPGTVQLGLFEPGSAPAKAGYQVTFKNIDITSDVRPITSPSP